MPIPRPTHPLHKATALAQFALLAFALATPTQADVEYADLKTTPPPVAVAKQTHALKLITYLIDKSHYRKLPLDDTFSAQVFDKYLERLDPGKNVFVQSDIDQLNKLQYQFDDFIRNGQLQPVFTIFSIFRTRMEQRVEYALARLEQPFDFTLDEAYQFDRKEAAWAQDSAALDELWRQRIKNDILNLRLSDKENEEIMTTLRRRYTHMARRTRQFKSEDVFQSFVNAYINTIEPHTSYFSPRASENFQINMRLSLEGIGAVLQTDNEYTQVRRVIPGGPADLAGQLKAEDRIIGVGQGDEEIVDVIGWRLDDVVALIRGPKESVVRLEILPDEGDGRAKVIAIQRDQIKLEEQAAKKRLLSVDTADGAVTFGVIDLPLFYIDFDGMHKKLPDYRSTTRDVRALLEEMQGDDIDGLVIDLRGNGGGSMAEAISLAGLFIKEGPIVQVQDTSGKLQINRDPDPEILYEGPLVVLVDRYSASSSEIFAGAIQDYHRGLIIGESTFGKGTVQHLLNLDRYAKGVDGLGQLKMTIAQYFRVNGDSTQHRGVVPDIAWAEDEDREESGERVYDNAIAWRNIEEAEHQQFAEMPSVALVEQLLRQHQQRIEASPRFQHHLGIKALNDERRQRDTVSLNEAARELDLAEWEQRQVELANRKRVALGEAVVASIEELEQETEEKREAAEAHAEEAEADADALLREGGNILRDWLLAVQEAGGGTVRGDGAMVTQDEAEQDESLSN